MINITIYTFNNNTNTLPELDVTYEYSDVDNGNGTTTRTIMADELPTKISFEGATGLQTVDFLNTNMVNSMSSMFSGCTSLTNVSNAINNIFNNIETGNKVIGYVDIEQGCYTTTGLYLTNGSPDVVTSKRINMYGILSNYDSATMTWISTVGDKLGVKYVYFFESEDSAVCKILEIADIGISDYNKPSYLFSVDNTVLMEVLSKYPYMSIDGWSTEGIAPNVDNTTITVTYNEKITTIGFNTSNVTNMEYMFYNCKSLTSLDLSNFDTINVTNMEYMFYNCKSLTSLDASNFDTSNVTNMEYMFYNCQLLTSLDVSNFDTSNVTGMNSMFCNCTNLTSLDVSNFDTSNVTAMDSMFYGCSNLTSLDLSNFNTSNVTAMDSMFYGCNNLLTIYLTNWNCVNSSVEDMFLNCGISQLHMEGSTTTTIDTIIEILPTCMESSYGVIFISEGITNNELTNYDLAISKYWVFEGVVIINLPYIIFSGIDIENGGTLGVLDKWDTVSFAALDDNNDTLHVTVYLNSVIIMEKTLSETDPNGEFEMQTISLTNDQWFESKSVDNEIRIIASEIKTDKPQSTEIVFFFDRTNADYIDFLIREPLIVDKKPNNIKVNIDWEVTNSYVQILVTNNGFDDEPLWEDASAEILSGQSYMFSNETKTSELWGVNVRFIAKKLIDDGECIYIDSFNITVV